MIVKILKNQIRTAVRQLVDEGFLADLVKKAAPLLVDGISVGYNLQTGEVTIKKDIVKKKF